jgi:hypothetical protein
VTQILFVASGWFPTGMMRPTRTQMLILRGNAMALSRLLLEAKHSDYIESAAEKYRKLRDMVERISKKTLDAGDKESLEFAIQLLEDPRIRRLIEPPKARSVRAIAVPFETNRSKH